MKKFLAYLLTVVITATAAISGTMAYLTKDVGTKVNTFNVGGLDVILTEEVDVTTNGGGEVETNEEGASYSDLMPGDKITKKVTVENTGDEDTYVRVTVTLNNADKINAAIDEVYEGKGYTKEAVQAMYDYIFDGWHINYNPRPGSDGVNDARGVIDGTYGLPEHVLKVDFSKTTDFDNDTTMFGISNWFKSDAEQVAADGGKYSAWLSGGGYYTSQLVDDPETTEDERDYAIIYTYYIELAEGESTTLFNGLNIPEEFNADQLAMFDGLTIDIDADAIQKANFADAKEAFEVLMNGGETIVKLVTNEEELMAAAEKGGHIILKDNITLTDINGVNFTEDTILNLNGYNLTAAGDAIVVTSGTLTIDGEGVVTAGGNGSYCAVWANGGHVVINDGTYVGSSDEDGVGNDTIYTKNGGTATINGGEYFAEKSNSFGGGNITQYTCLNENDANRGTITVTGGTFHRFSPAYNWSEGKGTNYLAEGYAVQKGTVDGHVVYVVYDTSMKDMWDGTADTSWYNETDTEFTLNTAEQLAGLSVLVDDGNTFEGKTIKLANNTDLYKEGNDEPISFNPIGSYAFDTPFKGTFDGQGYTISNMYQNGWALGNGLWDGDDCGLGLFGLVENATITNLKIDGANMPSECNLIGSVAGAAYGECVFEDITVTNSYAGNHSYYSGGIVGWASGDHKYINCDLDESNVISSQWGDFNNANGGIIGGAGKSGTYYFEDCDVACVIDSYNDVTSAYEWYAYRNAGMLIGNTGQTTTVDDTTYAAAPNVTCVNCTVTYGDWANYTYCQFKAMGYPWVRVQAGESCHAYGNARYDYAVDANGNNVVDENHAHNDGEGHNVLLVFDQLFGGSQGGVYGTATHDGVKIIYNNK